MTYSEKLRDPRWQKKRLEILQRDKFMCTICYDDTQMLIAHHRYYLKNKEPWEYDNDCYQTLCDYCHSLEHQFRPIAEQNLITALKQMNYSYVDIQMLSQIIVNIGRVTAVELSGIVDLLKSEYLSEGEIFDHCNPIPQNIKGMF